MRLRTATLLTTALTAAALTPLTLPTTATAAPATYADDFNGDGIRDFAAPEYDSESPGGAVRITFGTEDGPGFEHQVMDQGSPGVPGVDESNDSWGLGARVAADFNGDGYGDLAVGAMHEAVGRKSNQGSVTVLWGSPNGLSKGTEIPNKAPGAHKYFGRALAAGDFNGDGRPDLAATNGKTVYVYQGGITPSGVGRAITRLTKAGGNFTPGTLIAGKVTKDAATDLVITGEVLRSGEESDAWFIEGGSTLNPGATLRVSHDSPLGTDGVIADFDKDGYGDIAISDPDRGLDMGAVVLWRGGRNGPGASAELTQATRGIAGTPEKNDKFGSSLAAGDTDSDGYPDLAIGARGEKIDGKDRAGGVHVLRGGAEGLKSTGSKWFARNTRGVPGGLTEWDTFGHTVRLRDTNGDGYADLYVGAARDGARLQGSRSGITTAGAADLWGSEIVEGILQ
ncbi:FG-GAP and VCBS repeat-containing protein [Streptomyces spectabilis]|uniref:FG-GAP and VCBS repeat-containing protein n=1 Tax=Streptomyces spectabilis TaxID=68270 RepID=UPI0033FC3E2D